MFRSTKIMGGLAFAASIAGVMFFSSRARKPHPLARPNIAPFPSKLKIEEVFNLPKDTLQGASQRIDSVTMEFAKKNPVRDICKI